MTTDTTADPRIYTAALADALDGEWTDISSARINPIKTGHGTVVGGVSVEVLWGPAVSRDDSPTPVAVPDPGPSALGKFLRVTWMDGETLATDFLGRVQSAQPMADKSATTIVAEGILSCLARVQVLTCVEMTPLGDAPAWITADERSAWGAPPINGDYASQADPADMPIGAAPAYDRSSMGILWTAAQYSDYLLQRIAPNPLGGGVSGIVWELDGTAAAALDYELPRIETNAKRALDLLAEIWPQTRDLSFIMSAIDYATATVTIKPIVMTSGAVGYLDLDDGPFGNRSISLVRNVPGIAVTGGLSRCALSLYWDDGDADSSLVPFFTPGTAADDYLDGAADPDAVNDTAIWRTWQLSPIWEGTTRGSSTEGLTIIQGGGDGDREYQPGPAGTAALSVYAAKFERGTLAGSEILPRPVAIAWDSSAGTGVDLSPYGIVCNDSDKTISIGATIGDAAELRDLLNGKELIVSLAMTEPEPLAAWDEPAWPQGQPETVAEQFPALYRLRIAAGTVLGVDPDTEALTTQGAASIEHDDQAALVALRDGLAARYQAITGRASFSHLGIVDTWQPGDVFAGIVARGETYPYRLTVATVDKDPQSQRTTVALVPITAKKART